MTEPIDRDDPATDAPEPTTATESEEEASAAADAPEPTPITAAGTVTRLDETPDIRAPQPAGGLVPGADPITGLPAWVPAAVPSATVVQTPGPGEVRVIYRGQANMARFPNPAAPKDRLRDYVFRIDQPVIVPSEVAEELLTWPRERFEVVEE